LKPGSNKIIVTIMNKYNYLPTILLPFLAAAWDSPTDPSGGASIDDKLIQPRRSEANNGQDSTILSEIGIHCIMTMEAHFDGA
jgi:hypothetical protein